MKISINQVYDFIKKKTFNKFEKGEQVKITVNEIINSLDINEQTIYTNLKEVIKYDDIYNEVYQVRRTKNGRKIRFNQTIWWCE